ncbi:DUF5677 domain-containing protein [Alteromonas sp. PRIM-21]|uniref:DUF5677 domain-containing protein n=1 Tax=Alteromonas sp. PRIM-21 TaxID=1454978 RepID=UPI0022B986A8|nr:DUF5677 domain-containing protein [Alteromonas sp. PRIM-21]MCZ8528703.1 hypothetical protein [Alteromonas sp. PRIM-21]
MSNYKDMETEKGMLLWRDCFEKHIQLLTSYEITVRECQNERAVKLYPIFASIIEDSISLDILAKNSRVNQCYIISRALLERVINFCYLLYSPEEEYESFVAYTKNKVARSLSRKIEIGGQKKISLEFSGGQYELPKDYRDAVERFTSEKGREIPRWTKLNIEKRADFLDLKAGRNLLLHVLMIYGDASEALHGTLYGALFHLGTFSSGNIPSDQESLGKHRNNTLSFLYFMGSAAIGVLLFCLKENGVELSEAYIKADSVFKNAAEKSGLAHEARETRV